MGTRHMGQPEGAEASAQWARGSQLLPCAHSHLSNSLGTIYLAPTVCATRHHAGSCGGGMKIRVQQERVCGGTQMWWGHKATGTGTLSSWGGSWTCSGGGWRLFQRQATGFSRPRKGQRMAAGAQAAGRGRGARQLVQCVLTWEGQQSLQQCSAA